MGQKSITVNKKAWFMWLLAVTFFAFQFVLRLFPGLVMPEIMGKFQIDATAFGVLSAAYYFGYAGMQVPVGILLDRYNPRAIISVSAFICAIGTLSFIYSDHWQLTLLGRFLIGAGSAAGFIGTAKTIRLAFPEKYFTGMIGLTFTLGLSGALYGGKPVSLLIEQFGWISVSQVLALVSFALAIGVFLLFPRSTEETSATKSVQGSNSQIRESLKLILTNRKIIWLGITGGLLVGPFESFADVWGVSYLVNVYGFSKPDASLVTSGIYFGMLFGGPILSYVAEKLNAHYWVNAISALLMAVIFGLIIFADSPLERTTLMGMIVFVGVLCCYQAVVFSMACKLAPPHLSGLVTSVTNCINMLAGCLFHFVMGWIMDKNWDGLIQDGIKIYSSDSYVYAISIIPITLVIGFFGFLILKKTPDQSPAHT